MKKAILVLLCCAMLASTVSCNKSDGQTDKNIGENEISNGEITNASTSIDTINVHTTEIVLNNTTDSRSVLEELTASRCTLDAFKQKFPDYRFVTDTIDYCVLKTKSLPNTYFFFERLSGENGFSKYLLESISAPAEVVLPEFLDFSLNEIENLYEHTFRSQGVAGMYSEPGNLYLYKEKFFCEIRGNIHGEKLTCEHIFLYPYTSKHLPIEGIDISRKLQTSISEPNYESTIKDIILTNCSLNNFKETFTQKSLRQEGDYIFISVEEFINLEFCFKRFVDEIHGRSEYVIHSITGNANILLSNYIGQDFFSLNQKSGIFEFIPNSLDIVSYDDIFSYKICYDNLKEYSHLEEYTQVTLLPYSDTWIRPW